jgi:hypothetical protein
MALSLIADDLHSQWVPHGADVCDEICLSSQLGVPNVVHQQFCMQARRVGKVINKIISSMATKQMN